MYIIGQLKTWPTLTKIKESWETTAKSNTSYKRRAP